MLEEPPLLLEMLRMVAYEMLKKAIGKIRGLMVVDFLGQWGDKMEGMCSKMFQSLLLKGLLAEVWKKSKDVPWSAVTLDVDPRSLSPMESPTLSASAPS